MKTVRIGLANAATPASGDDAVRAVIATIGEAARGGAEIVCFPECFVPGYRVGCHVQAPDEGWLARSWERIDRAAEREGVGVILGTERVIGGGLRITARVTDGQGRCLGFQDKTQLDPSEEGTYAPGVDRRVFRCGEVTFGVVICHEGWRYPETVRWAAREGAWIVFHPHFEVVQGAGRRVAGFADPANTFHEKAALCRAAENVIWFATVTCALEGGTTTSAVVDPEGVLMAHQPHGRAGLLLADLDPARATGLLARRLRPERLAPSAE